MNIGGILKSRIANETPLQPPPSSSSYQNMLYPNPYQFFPSSQQQNPYQYQPLINVPTRTNTTTIGEIGASVEMIRAQVTELSRRMESLEFKFSEFEKNISNDIFLFKNTLSDHSTELLHARDVVECTRAHVKDTNELIKRQDVCIDKLADAVYHQSCMFNGQRRHQNRINKTAANIDLGMIRRRLSKVEDFTSEFYEQFQSFKCVKDIILNLSEHLDECDRDISSVVVAANNKKCHENDDDDDILASALQDATATVTLGLDNYFSNYDDHDNDHKDDDECHQNNLSTFMKNDQEQQNMKEEEHDDDFERL